MSTNCEADHYHFNKTCIPCSTPCNSLFRIMDQDCSSVSDYVCGDCISGYKQIGNNTYCSLISSGLGRCDTIEAEICRIFNIFIQLPVKVYMLLYSDSTTEMPHHEKAFYIGLAIAIVVFVVAAFASVWLLKKKRKPKPYVKCGLLCKTTVLWSFNSALFNNRFRFHKYNYILTHFNDFLQ